MAAGSGAAGSTAGVGASSATGAGAAGVAAAVSAGAGAGTAGSGVGAGAGSSTTGAAASGTGLGEASTAAGMGATSGVAAGCWIRCSSAGTLMCSACETVRAAVIWVTWASSASMRARASSHDLGVVIVGGVGYRGPWIETNHALLPC